jgi:hypothetical protein
MPSSGNNQVRATEQTALEKLPQGVNRQRLNDATALYSPCRSTGGYAGRWG